MSDQMTASQVTAWQEGYAQGMRFGLTGEPINNPYPVGSIESDSWIAGSRQGYLDS